MKCNQWYWMNGVVAATIWVSPGFSVVQAAPINEQDMLEALSQENVSKAFRRTAAPDSNNYCPEVSGPAGNAASKTLQVVPYTADSPARVDLSIQFVTGSDKLTSADKSQLDMLAHVLNNPQLTGIRFAVAGHTDAQGAYDINQVLSCARALSVRRYLMTRGVAGERLSAYGFGSSRPVVADNPTHASNRRVEIRRE